MPTPAHFFMKLLHDKGLLLRCFTQNIDSLENQAGLPKDAIVAAHGNFDSEHLMRVHDSKHSLLSQFTKHYALLQQWVAC